MTSSVSTCSESHPTTTLTQADSTEIISGKSQIVATYSQSTASASQAITQSPKKDTATNVFISSNRQASSSSIDKSTTSSLNNNEAFTLHNKHCLKQAPPRKKILRSFSLSNLSNESTAFSNKSSLNHNEQASPKKKVLRSLSLSNLSNESIVFSNKPSFIHNEQAFPNKKIFRSLSLSNLAQSLYANCDDLLILNSSKNNTPAPVYTYVSNEISETLMPGSETYAINPENLYQVPDVITPDFHRRIFSEEERRLAFELIAICKSNKEERNRCEIAKVFFKMGIIYRAKSPDKFSLIRAAALFNAARVRNSAMEERITEHLVELSNHILYLAGAKNNGNLVGKAKELTKKIEFMRLKVRKALDTVKPIAKGLNKSALRSCEAEKVEILRDIQCFLTEDYITIMASLSEFCNHIMGTPPCQYAVVGMGSLARKEVTPFSDFEHSIVLEEGCQNSENYEVTMEHFRWYSVIFHVVVINLMETIIPSVAIPYLNDFSSVTGNWFFDVYTNRGISFDGMMAHACKFPLGRQEETIAKPFIAELIKPISEMLSYLDSDVSLKHGYHLGDILTKTCFVYGNKELYNKFSQAVKKKLQSIYEKRCFSELKIQLQDDLVKFAIGKEAINKLKLQKNFNVKQLLYRSTTLFIAAWGRLEGIDASSSFDVISRLSDRSVISTNQKHKLMYAVALACEIRLRVYFQKSKQNDTYQNLTSHQSSCHPLLNVVGEISLINYFQIAYALQLQMCRMLNLEPLHLICDPAMLNVNICSALGLQEATNNLLHVCIGHSAPNINVYDFDECLGYLEGLLDHSFSFSPSTNKLSPQEIANRFMHFAEHFFGMQMFDKAFDNVLQALKICKTISAESIFQAKCCELAGCCLVHMEKYNKGWFYFEKVLKIYQRFSAQKNQIALTYHYLGICLVHNEYFRKAKVQFLEALSIYENQKSHKDVAETTFYIGLCLSELTEYPLSDLYLKKSLKIYRELTNSSPCCKEHVKCLLCLISNQKMKPNQSNDLTYFRSTLVNHMNLVLNCDIESAATLFQIGKLLFELDFFDFSHFFLLETLKIYEKANDGTMDRTICNVYSNIGLCLQKKREYSQSLVYLQDASSLCQAISVNVSEDKDVALSFQRIGVCLLEMNFIQDSYVNFERALTIFESVVETEESQRQLAALHNDIGVCNMEMHEYAKALTHLQKSLEIMSLFAYSEIISSEDLTLNNMGKCLMKLHKYNEALETFRKALKLQENLNVNLSSLDMVVTLNNLGLCLSEIKNWHASFKYFARAYNMCAQALTSGSALIQDVRRKMADTLNNLGLHYMNVKSYKFAVKSFQEALSYYDSISTSSDRNEDICLVYNNLGLCFMTVKSYQKALGYFHQSLEFFESSSASDKTNLITATLCNNIGLCLIELELSTDSFSFFYKALALYQKANPSSSSQDVAVVMHNIGLADMNCGELEESLHFLMKALDLFQESCTDSDSNSNLAEIFESIGVCITKKGEYDEALSYFVRSYTIRCRSCRGGDSDLLRTLQHCGLCYIHQTLAENPDLNFVLENSSFLLVVLNFKLIISICNNSWLLQESLISTQ